MIPEPSGSTASTKPSESTPAGVAGHGDPGLEEAAELLRALANPHRLGIVGQLAGGARCVHELVDALGISQPLVSQHLRVLRASKLVHTERRGREIAYRLGDDHVAHIVHDAVVHATELRTPRLSSASKEGR